MVLHELIATAPPRVFMSYSHDSEEHKNWVLQLAARLVANGVDVLLDRWNVRLGGNLQLFMESSADTDRVLAVCTTEYVRKADAAEGGVGYEKTILTAELIADLTSARVIPVLRANPAKALPRFLTGRKRISFLDNAQYEASYAELLYDIHGMSISPRPPIGENPILAKPVETPPNISRHPSRYVSPGLSGQVAFNYSNNDGRYIIGAGDMAFETYWSEAGHGSIHVLSDPPSIRSVALAEKVRDITTISDARVYDPSSRARTAYVGDTVVFQNTAGYYAVARVDSVKNRHSPSGAHDIVFSYTIQPNKSADFSKLAPSRYES